MLSRTNVSRVWRAHERPDYSGALLLDTHAWIWFLEGDASRLAPAALELLQRASAAANIVVCDVSFWEVANKAANGRLVLSMETPLWLRRAERAPGIGFVPLDRETLLLSARLPGTPPGDPADRMLIAAAQLNSAPLVTVDPEIIDYASTERGIPVCDARPPR
jgi:PIN domain nuclease of toxin-antitoxin system